MRKRTPIFCVTGTPGCGKTQFAKKLAAHKKLRYVPLHEILHRERLYVSYDRQMGSYAYREKRVERFLIGLITAARKLGEGLVIDGHLSHCVPRQYVDQCFVVTCDVKTLKRRLRRRGYSERKIRENLDAEILDVCLVEARERGHKVTIVSQQDLRRPKKWKLYD